MIRESKLFIAGDYPDKNLKITEADLGEYVANFSPCPVKIEHQNTPFDGVLGTLKSVYQKGCELFGKIDFIDEAWNLMEKAGAKKLSICLNPCKKSIEEVSIVSHPRVADAKVFSVDINEIFSEDIYRENQRLKEELADIRAEEKAKYYFDKGKITPASKPLVKEIFKEMNKVTFSDRNLFEEFLESLPKVVDFSRIEREYKKENKYSDDEIEFAKKLGVKLGGE